MSTARCRWALACFSFSCALAGFAAGMGVEPPPESEEWLRLELELAQRGDLYLVVRPEVPVLEIRARGVVLDRVPLTGVVLLAWQPPDDTCGESAESAPLPRLWRVAGRAPSVSRRFIAPSQLRPWGTESAEQSEPSAPPPPAAVEEIPILEPSHYTVDLEGGWELRVVQELPPRGWLARFRETLADGWRRLRGGDRPPRPHLIMLALDAERARALHHLFHPGVAVVVAGAPPPELR